jgi:hypothetical protein
MTLRRSRRSLRLLMMMSVAAAPLAAQTDYYNTDAGRPVQMEDAMPLERGALELQLAPLRVERRGEGRYRWQLEPELAWGVLPHTQLEVGLPLHWTEGPERSVTALAGIRAAALYNLNVETRTLPALAFTSEATLPAGGLGPANPLLALGAIATRTQHWGRVHLNGRYTAGPADADDDAARWMAGAALDHSFPFTSTLVTVDVVAEQPLAAAGDVRWTAETGIRYQTSPQFSLDAGIGRRFSGDPAWIFTFGFARAFSLRALVPR